MINNHKGESICIKDKQRPAAVKKKRPKGPIHLIPYLSNNLPVIGDIKPIINAGGIITSPETVGE